MRRIAFLAFSLLLGGLAGSNQPEAPSEPVIEFTFTDSSAGGADSLTTVRACDYYLLVRGRLGHSVGFRPGVSLHVLGDTLAVRVDQYRASEFTSRDWRDARWTLRIGFEHCSSLVA